MIPRKLQSIVDAVLREPKRNPPVDPATLLQGEIAARGLKNAFSEGQMVEAASAVGVADDDMVEFLEEMASWI